MGKEPDPSFLHGIDPFVSAYRDLLFLPMKLGTAWLNLVTGWAKPKEISATVEPGPIKVPEAIEKHDESNLFA